jgi:predicted aspartyl protease
MNLGSIPDRNAVLCNRSEKAHFAAPHGVALMPDRAFTRRLMLAGLAAQAGGAWAGEPDPAPAAQYAIPTGRDGIGRIIAPVMINGAGPFRFLVDTGANRTAISAGLARRLSLPAVTGAALVQGVTGAEYAGKATIATMAADRLVWRDIAAPVIGVGVLDEAEGVLGADSFHGMRISVDFLRDRIGLAPARAMPPPGGLTIARCRLIKGALLAAPARIGAVPVTAVIDTGAERSIANSALITALSASGPPPSFVLDTLVMGVVGPSMQAPLVSLPALAMGDLRVRGLNAAHLDAPIFRVWALDAKPAILIGMDVLGQVEELVIDYRAPALWLRFPPPPIETGSRTGAQSSLTARSRPRN